MKAIVAVLAMLVLALGVLNVQLMRRQRVLEDQMTALRKNDERAAQSDERRTETEEDGRQETVLPRQAPTDSGPSPVRPSPVVMMPSALNAPSASTVPPSLTPEQQKAVAGEVERIIKERFPHLPSMAGDPLEVMEKELELSAAQKLRIGELLKQHEQEMEKLIREGKMGEAFGKIEEMQERYETAVKQELTVAQQEKYETLKNEGRLGPVGGAVFHFGARRPR